MYRLLETIKIRNGEALNLNLHENRANNSRFILMKLSDSLNLTDYIAKLKLPEKGTHKLRVIYSDKIISHTMEPYFPKLIRSLKLVYNDDIDYTYKYEDRKALSKLLELKGRADEIIIVKKGFITDTSYTNLAFFDGYKYYTPALPLLKGTKREHLINDGFLIEEIITPDDLKRFSRVFLINAMLDIADGIGVSIENIIR